MYSSGGTIGARFISSASTSGGIRSRRPIGSSFTRRRRRGRRSVCVRTSSAFSSTASTGCCVVFSTLGISSVAKLKSSSSFTSGALTSSCGLGRATFVSGAGKSSGAASSFLTRRRGRLRLVLSRTASFSAVCGLSSASGLVAAAAFSSSLSVRVRSRRVRRPDVSFSRLSRGERRERRSPRVFFSSSFFS